MKEVLNFTHGYAAVGIWFRKGSAEYLMLEFDFYFTTRRSVSNAVCKPDGFARGL